MFGDLARMFSQQGPLNWDVARQIAFWLATEGQAEANVDPIERMRLEELGRVADLHVGQATGLPTSVTGRPLTILPVTRSDWTNRSLEAHRPLLERLAASLGRSTPEPGGGMGAGAGLDDDPLGGPDPTTQLLGSLGQLLGPVLMGLQTGSMLGHLSRRALGQYDLPIPRAPSDELLVVPANVDELATEWSLPADDLRLWVCLREVSHHAVLGRPHVRARLEELMGAYVSGFEIDPDALESSLGEVDPTDLAGFQAVLGNPETLLGAMQTSTQRDLLVHLEALTCAIEGYVDHVLDRVGRGLVGSFPMIDEALRRRRVETGEGDRFVERLLGLELGQAQYDRGAAFVRGVVERAGDDALVRLWQDERDLPTPAEIDAPGLWLARIDL